MTGEIGMGTALTSSVATIALHNPYSSGINCVLLRVYGHVSSRSATNTPTQFVLAGFFVQNQAAPTGPPVLIPSEPLLLSSTSLTGTSSIKQSKAFAYSTATYPANPVHMRGLGFMVSPPSTTDTLRAYGLDIDGAIVLPPNTAVTIQGVGVNHNGRFGLTWEEVDI